jgi:DNA-binding LacI/PurR family transcriptional regulator
MKYFKIYKKLKSEILEGKYKPLSKIPGMPELMRYYKASNNTVHKAIKILENQGMLKGIRNISGDNPFLSLKKVPRVAIVGRVAISDLMKSFYSNRVSYVVELTVEKRGGHINLMSCKSRSIFEIIREINLLECNAVVTIELDNIAYMKELDALNIPVVHLEYLEITGKSPMIVSDSVQGGAISFRKLYELGHRKILYLNKYIPSLGKVDLMSARRWTGIKNQAKKFNFKNIRQEIISYERTGREKRIQKVLDNHRDYTGIISSMDCQRIKHILEKRPESETKNMDFIIFDAVNTPGLINRKPVYFCMWDGNLMGDLAIKTLLDKKKKYPRVQYMPMYLERNL